MIAARRQSTIRDLVQATSLARTVEDFAASALASFESNPYDIPFVMLYTVHTIQTRTKKKEVRTGEDKVKMGLNVKLRVSHFFIVSLR